jgi:hypothetical protein
VDFRLNVLVYEARTRRNTEMCEATGKVEFPGDLTCKAKKTMCQRIAD